MRTTVEKAIRRAMLDEVKAVLQAMDGRVDMAAAHLGMHRTKLSRMLNSNPTLKPWWRKYRDDLKKKRARARQQRWIDRKAVREGLVVE